MISEIRPYFTTVAKSIGLKEHTDAFFDENIASSVIDKSFHVLLEQGNTTKVDNNFLSLSFPCRFRFWIKGYQTPTVAATKAEELVEIFIKAACKADLRLGQACIKNVLPGSILVEGLANDNDNVAQATISFTVLGVIVLN
jgi:hypothetical protein